MTFDECYEAMAILHFRTLEFRKGVRSAGMLSFGQRLAVDAFARNAAVVLNLGSAFLDHGKMNGSFPLMEYHRPPPILTGKADRRPLCDLCQADHTYPNMRFYAYPNNPDRTVCGTCHRAIHRERPTRAPEKMELDKKASIAGQTFPPEPTDKTCQNPNCIAWKATTRQGGSGPAYSATRFMVIIEFAHDAAYLGQSGVNFRPPQHSANRGG